MIGQVLSVCMTVSAAGRARLYVNGQLVVRGTHAECQAAMNRVFAGKLVKP